MEITINIMINLTFSIIDVYLLKTYLKYKTINIINNNFVTKLISFIFLFFSNWIIYQDYILNIICYTIFGVLIIFRTDNLLNNLKHIIIMCLLRFITVILTIPFCEWLFDTPISIIQMNKYILYSIFICLFCRYIMFCSICFIAHKSNKITSNSFRIFKLASMITSIFFCINIIVYNDKLFYFNNIGRTFVLVIFIYNTMLILFDRYQTKHENIEKEMAIINHNINSERDYIAKYNESKEIIREIRHDLRNNYSIISGYLNNGDTENAQKYINRVMGKLDESCAMEHIGHPCIDCVIDEKINLMKSKGIHYEENIIPVYLGNIEIEDLALLIGLALDNAIEAAEKSTENKEIAFEIKNNKKILVMNIRNSIHPSTRPRFDRTSKKDKDNHGFGVKKIQYFANLYNGEAKYTVNDNKVSLKVYLNAD